MKNINNFLYFYKCSFGDGDWGLGIGDWGLGIGPNPQSPIPIEIINLPNINIILFLSFYKNS